MVKKVLAVAGTAATSAFAFASTVLAQGTTTDISVNPSEAGFKITDVSKLINALLKFTLGIVGLLVFVYLIWGGIEWLTAGGDKSKTESARTKITNAIIGLAIVAAAFAISTVLSNFFGINVGGNIQLPSAY